MRFNRASFTLILLLTSLTANSHNPEKLVISEIERGQLTFENDQIAAEYNAALKRQRIRRLNAMTWIKKVYIFIKAGLSILFLRVLITFFLSLVYFFQLKNLDH